jgi:hypothetical protein
MRAGRFTITRELFNSLLGLPEDTLVIQSDVLLSSPGAIRITVVNGEGLPEVIEGESYPELKSTMHVERCEHGAIKSMKVEFIA